MRPFLRHPASVAAPLLSGLAYFVLATIALVSSRFEGGLAFIWAANALLMAELQTSKTSYWPRLILCCGVASVLATALFGMGFTAALPMSVINMAEALIVASICHRFVPLRSLSDQANRPLLVFTLALCLPANLVAAPAAALVASTLTPVSFGESLLQWYSGHVLGALTCTPILMMLLQGEVGRWWRETPSSGKLEALSLLILLAIAAIHIFYVAQYPMLFAVLLPLVAIAFRVGYLGAAASVVILALIGGVATVTGHGPFHMVPGTLGERVQFLQLFLAFSFLLSLPVAAELNGRRRLFQMLQESEARYRAIAENSGDVVLNVSVNGIIQYASPSAAEHLGCEAGTLVGRTAALLVDDQDRGNVVATHRRALARPGRSQTVEFRPSPSANGTDWCEMVTRAVLDERGLPIGVVSTIRDMSRHKARQRALQQVAAVDALTGADSRRAFLEKLEEELTRLQQGGRSSLALIDIDHFKSVNDRFGHCVGDEVLSAFVRHLKPGLRSVDSIGRLGGEEFAILFSGADIERAKMACDRLRKLVSLQAVRNGEGEAISVTFSAGLVELDGRLPVVELIEAADKALYRAKDSGRNCLRLAA